jgi:hypothetical protein
MKRKMSTTRSRLAAVIGGLGALAMSGVASSAITYNIQMTTVDFYTGGTFRGGVFEGQVVSSNPSNAPQLLGGGNGGLAPGDNVASTFWAWCIQPTEYINVPSATLPYTLSTLEAAPIQLPGTTMGTFATSSGINAPDAMRYLVGTINPDLDGQINKAGSDDITAGTSDATLRAAFQLALWEISYERDKTVTPYSVNTGDAKFTAGTGTTTQAIANDWLAAIYAVIKGGSAGIWTKSNNVFALTNASSQDFIVTTVPIPAAAWLFGSALLGMLAVARRREKVA